jgi:23S rRNA (uridine2552-2'-O)-methyltransferase
VSRKQPYAGADAHAKAARAKGYPARSVFKLEEIDRRMKILRPGARVLDLGAAPGSWSLFASQRVGANGRVLAIDLKPISQAFPGNVTVAEGDALTLETAALSSFAPYDVVLSDMAPNTSGSKVSDQARSFELLMRALEIAAALGRKGSHFAGKLFMSSDFQEARAKLSSLYGRSQVIRPDSVRSNSSEVFLVGLDKRTDGTNPSREPNASEGGRP